MKAKIILLSLFLGIQNQAFSQNSTLTPQGVMFPQMTTVQINALTGQAKGTMVFDNSLNLMKYWDGTAWQSVTNTSSSGAWQSSGNDQITTNTGNVGIGISTPQAKLSVNGNLGLYEAGVEYGFLSKNSTNGALRLNAGLSFNAFSTPKNIGLQVNSMGGLGSTLVAGNVGIGTDEPEDKLTAYTANNKYGLLHSNGTIKLGSYIGGGAGWLGTKSNHPLIIHTNNGANQHYFRENGRVGLGIEFPEQKLHVNGSIKTEAGIYGNQSGLFNLVPLGIIKLGFSIDNFGTFTSIPWVENEIGNVFDTQLPIKYFSEYGALTDQYYVKFPLNPVFSDYSKIFLIDISSTSEDPFININNYSNESNGKGFVDENGIKYLKYSSISTDFPIGFVKHSIIYGIKKVNAPN
jgi:hypothetical protein